MVSSSDCEQQVGQQQVDTAAAQTAETQSDAAGLGNSVPLKSVPQG